MGSNAQISMPVNSQPNIQKEPEQSIFQAAVTNTNRNAEENTNEVISSSVEEAPSIITYIHFREIPKDSLKTDHINMILGPERATRPEEVEWYRGKILERKTALRIWGNQEVSIF